LGERGEVQYAYVGRPVLLSWVWGNREVSMGKMRNTAL
jgi:hypothetical protein